MLFLLRLENCLVACFPQLNSNPVKRLLRLEFWPAGEEREPRRAFRATLRTSWSDDKLTIRLYHEHQISHLVE